MKTEIYLIATGSIGIDDIKTPYEDKKNLLGGSLPFITASASFFTCCGAVGVVGDDFPDTFRERWGRFNVDLSGVSTLPGETFRWACEYDQDICERTTLKTNLGVFEEFQPQLPEEYKNVQFVLLGNIQPQLQLDMLQQCAPESFTALDTMNLWIEIERGNLTGVIGKVDLLIINDSEARLLIGERNLRKCAKSILQMEPKYVIIKKGEHGAILFSQDNMFIVPAYPINHLKDPTGAGDTFAGAFMGFLASQGTINFATMRKAMLYASAAASFCVEGFSFECLEGLDRQAIEQRVSELITLTAVQI